MLRLARFSGAVVLLMFISTVSADAHTGSNYYDTVGGATARMPWDTASDTTYAFSSGSTWGSGWKEAIRVAHDKWNNVLGSTLFADLAQEHAFPGTSCGNDFNGQEIIRRGETLNNALARTVICKDGSGNYGRWFITIDPDYTWYVDSGDAPAGQTHLRGIMTHEFGHATGLGTGPSGGHFTDSSACPSLATDQSTMCGSWGTTYNEVQYLMTSLELHDTHTFLNVY